MAVEPLTKHTPLESFINHKNETGMQCGNYSIDIPDLKPGEQYRFHFDATACVGCHCCEVACNEQNANPDDIKWRRVGEMEMGEFPDTLQLFNSMSCNHCIEPECLIGCPTESYIKLDNGIVWHDDPSCIGCQYCTWNCPYEVPTFNPDRGIVTKCHMCVDKLEAGQTPACVQACPGGAIEIETVNVEQWLAEDMAKEGVAPHLPDIDITKPTTRYTLPELKEGEEIRPADEHLLKPAHPELPLVFMTVLTQISLGGFFGLMMGHLLSLFGLSAPNWIMAAAVMLPAALGLPLSALHLGRPFLAMTAMKNWRTSWLSREAVALGAFTGMMTLNIALYFLNFPSFLHVLFELLTLGVGVYGIYAQSMIYRIKARPAWDRITTNLKFFGAAYSGFFLLALVALVLGETSASVPLVATGMILAMAQGFFTYEDRRTLSSMTQNRYELERSERIYSEFFKKQAKIRWFTLGIGAIALPLLVLVLVAVEGTTSAALLLVLTLLLSMGSEFMDRFLFYATVVPLGMAGSFFAGKQRH